MKSHVSMEQRVCMICTKEYDTGAILIDKRLQDSLDRTTTTGWGICNDCEAMNEKGYVALVGVDASRSEVINGNIKPEAAYRTGGICHIRKSKIEDILGIEPPERAFIWVEQGVINNLEKCNE